MVRRLQLMEPERRTLGQRVAEAAERLRDGLLRDNKVLPPVLAALALIIFAWLLAGVVIDGTDENEERVARQAAQPTVAQSPEEGASAAQTPAPEVENRDSESLDVYESKDPFRELFPPADAADDAAGGDTTGTDGATGTDDGSGTGSDGATDGTGTDSDDGSSGGGGAVGSGAGGDQYGDGGDDFSDGTGSGNGSGGGSGSGNGGGGSGNGGGGAGGGGSGQIGGDGDGNGSLFDSGGTLSP